MKFFFCWLVASYTILTIAGAAMWDWIGDFLPDLDEQSSAALSKLRCTSGQTKKVGV